MTGNRIVFIDSSNFSGPSKRYAPVGTCIYCGTSTTRLGLEHVVPFGLAGNALLLPGASCKNCEAITGGNEQAVLRQMLGPLRVLLGLPTRNKKDRPVEFPLYLDKLKGGVWTPEEKLVAQTHELPGFAYLRLRRAGILDGKPASGIIDGQLEYRHLNPKEMFIPQRFKPDMKADEYRTRVGVFNPEKFGKMLAKIAHAYATAEVGFGLFRPLVTDFILGKVNTMSHWVGGDWKIPPAHPAAFQLAIENVSTGGYRYLVVNVRLFSFLELPQYHVVVGEV